jgi:hypothetical protein
MPFESGPVSVTMKFEAASRAKAWATYRGRRWSIFEPVGRRRWHGCFRDWNQSRSGGASEAIGKIGSLNELRMAAKLQFDRR